MHELPSAVDEAAQKESLAHAIATLRRSLEVAVDVADHSSGNNGGFSPVSSGSEGKGGGRGTSLGRVQEEAQSRRREKKARRGGDFIEPRDGFDTAVVASGDLEGEPHLTGFERDHGNDLDDDDEEDDGADEFIPDSALYRLA